MVQDFTVIDEIKKHSRKLIGLDMETYAVFFAGENCSKPRPSVFAVKSVSDFADESKRDDFQEYASIQNLMTVKKRSGLSSEKRVRRVPAGKASPKATGRIRVIL